MWTRTYSAYPPQAPSTPVIETRSGQRRSSPILHIWHEPSPVKSVIVTRLPIHSTGSITRSGHDTDRLVPEDERGIRAI